MCCRCRKLAALFAVTACFLIMSSLSLNANPSFTIGSNPFLTVFAYPHDLLKWPDRGVVFSTSPQTLPWQGDVTDISNRPSEAYTSSYQSVEFATPTDYLGAASDVRSWMEVSSYAYKDRYTLGGLHTNKYGKFLLQLGMTKLDMELTSEGVGRSSESGYILVPFEAKTLASRDDLDFALTYANRLFNRPVGFRLKYVSKSSDQPNGYVKFTRGDGVTVDTPHLTWGWATTGCNHIFGYSSINTDAFFQSGYSVYSGNQLDLQISTENGGNHKSGLRYRRTREDGENYSWQYNEGDEFHGNYYVDDVWNDRKLSKLIRAYSKVRFYQIGQADLGMLFFLQRNTYSKTRVNKVSESDPDREEHEGQFILETNPWMNYKADWGYFDFGFLLELSRTGMKNTQTRWNGVSHADQPDVLWSTTPYHGWSTDWENFSKGHNWFFATGFEAGTSVNVYRRLALQTTLTVLKKFTRAKKVYGTSEIPSGGSSYEFNQTHVRNDSRNEAWMTGAVGFTYGFGPVQALVTMQLPTAYLITQTTKLSDGGGQLFEHSKKSMWQVQTPMTSRVLLVWALGKRPASTHGQR